MAITKKLVEDKHEVVGDFKIIQVRTATVIEEDGVELSRSFSRASYSPTDDTSSASEDVKAFWELVLGSIVFFLVFISKLDFLNISICLSV